MWITDGFKSLNQVKGIVRLIYKKDILEAFKWVNKERLIPLFMPSSKVIRKYCEKTYEEIDSCSSCGYEFRIDETGDKEADYHYCVNCLKELACCNDKNCDKDRERAEESMISFLYNIYKINY